MSGTDEAVRVLGEAILRVPCDCVPAPAPMALRRIPVAEPVGDPWLDYLDREMPSAPDDDEARDMREDGAEA